MQEWYLLKRPYDQLSGFEEEALEDFGVDGFLEALDSVGIVVELCNYDLSICTEIRAVLQNNTADTDLKTLNRILLVPIGTCKAGMYIKYKNRYWLIVGLVDDNGIYEKAIMTLCNYLLTWENKSGDIIQRWANVASASQYNNGETFTRNYYLRSDQLLILTPNDDESLLMDSGQKYIIDKKCEVYAKKFDSSVTCDTSNTVMVYQMTRPDTVLFDFVDSGYFEFIASQEEQGENDGYYVIDGKGYWLCGVPKRFNKSTTLSCVIECNSPDIYNGIEPTIYTAIFYDSNGEVVDDVEPTWNFDCDFADELTIEYVDDSIMVSVDNRKLINKTFSIELSADGYESCVLPVTIKALI